MRLFVIFGLLLLVSACAGPRGNAQQQTRGAQQNQTGQRIQPVSRTQFGQYQRPGFSQPQLTQRTPTDDVCRSRLFLGLIGQHEGSIVFSSLPGRTRVVKPAETEETDSDFLSDMQPDSPFVEIREYLAGQILYAPAIRAVRLGDTLGPIEQDRLTVELNQYGYVSGLSCR